MLNDRLLASAKSLVGSLKADLKNGEYGDMAAKIGAWETKQSADLRSLTSALNNSLELSPLATLIQYIRDVKAAAENA
jgi:hypothetical protein